MGANGSFANGTTDSEAGRNWKTIDFVGDVEIIKKKNPKDSNKLPEESHSPNQTYAIFESDGSDVKAIAKYGPDGKKLWEIHTAKHEDFAAHYHPWKDGHPIKYKDSKGKIKNVTYKLTSEMEQLLNKIRNYEK